MATKSLDYNGTTFKIGDKVRIERKVESYSKNGMGEGKHWEAVWNDHMHRQVGAEGVIVSLSPSTGAKVEIEGMLGWNYPLSALRHLTSKPIPRFDLKPFMRAVTRNGWQWIVCTHDAIADSGDEYAPLVLLRENSNWTYISWPGQTTFPETEIVEVYEPPPLVHDLLTREARGKIIWHEHIDVEREERGQIIGRLLQQQADIAERIQQLQQEQSECKLPNLY